MTGRIHKGNLHVRHRWSASFFAANSTCFKVYLVQIAMPLLLGRLLVEIDLTIWETIIANGKKIHFSKSRFELGKCLKNITANMLFSNTWLPTANAKQHLRRGSLIKLEVLKSTVYTKNTIAKLSLQHNEFISLQQILVNCRMKHTLQWQTPSKKTESYIIPSWICCGNRESICLSTPADEMAVSWQYWPADETAASTPGKKMKMKATSKQ